MKFISKSEVLSLDDKPSRKVSKRRQQNRNFNDNGYKDRKKATIRRLKKKSI